MWVEFQFRSVIRLKLNHHRPEVGGLSNTLVRPVRSKLKNHLYETGGLRTFVELILKENQNGNSRALGCRSGLGKETTWVMLSRLSFPTRGLD